MSAPIRLPFEPRTHQREAHAARKRFSVLVWHRRSGKTVYAVVELIMAALACKRARGRFAYVAPYLRQAKDVAWTYLKDYTRGIPGVAFNEAELSVKLPSGAEIRIYGADHPDTLRGLYFDGIVLDEVADMRPNVWGEIVRPALADREGWALFIGTPKGVNLFSELYYRALKEPDWYADLRRASDTDAIPREEIERARREMSANQFAQEFDCDFGAAVENSLIPLDAALAAKARTIGNADFHYAPIILGVDVARYGGDRSVIFPRQGLATHPPIVLKGLDQMEVASVLARAIDKFKPRTVFVDNSPASYGVIDRTQQLGHAVSGIDFGGKPVNPRFENRRAEMWWDMAEWVKAGGCLPDLEALVGELTAPTYTYANARGKLQLESKEAMKARGLPSPDLGDGLALTFAEPVPPTETLEAARPWWMDGKPANVTDYDPYAPGVS